MAYTDVLYESAAGIATITINRPDRLNAIRQHTMTEIADAIQSANREGVGRRHRHHRLWRSAFSAGGDLRPCSPTPNQAGARSDPRRCFTS